MENKGLANNDVLKEIFELPKEWAKALFSIEYYLTANSIAQESNDVKKRLKEKWLQNWGDNIVKQFNAVPGEEPFSLIRDHAMLMDYLRSINSESKQRSHAYLTIIEALFFRPFFSLGASGAADEYSKGKLRYKLDIEYLSSFSKVLGISRELLGSFQSSFRKSYMTLSGATKRMFWATIASGALLAVTGGLAAPKIAILFAAPGLTGAAAISSGLAALGGGAVAVGGAGMAGGIAVLVTAGGIVGVTGGAAIGALAASSPAVAAIIAAKLEVYYKDVVFPILNDPELARSILRGQESFLDTLYDQLRKSPNITETEKKAYKAIQKAIRIFQKSLARNREILLKHT